MRGSRRSPNGARIARTSARNASSSRRTEGGPDQREQKLGDRPRTGTRGRAARAAYARRSAHCPRPSDCRTPGRAGTCAPGRAPASRSAGMPATSSPARRIEPSSGRSCPLTRLKSVDLPAPFGPMMLTSSPSRDSKLHAVDGGEAAEAPGQPRDGEEVRHAQTVPNRPCGRKRIMQQQHHAVDQHPVFGGEAEGFRQADERSPRRRSRRARCRGRRE